MSTTLRPTLIFDLDNTLLECSKYYNDAKQSFAMLMQRRHGVTVQFALEMLGAIDVQCTKLPNAFSRERFPRSFQAAAAVLDIIQDKAVDAAVGAEAWALGDSVFSAPYPVYRGVKKLLQQYQRGGWHLVLCRKGVDDVQQRKLDINGLHRFFQPSSTYITLVKSPELLRTILVEQGSDVNRTWFIGDSMRDDIGPANEVGIGTVWIAGHLWGYETAKHEATHSITGVTSLPAVLPPDSTAKTAQVRRKGRTMVG